RGLVPRSRAGTHRLPRPEGVRVPRLAPRDPRREGASSRAARGGAAEGRNRVVSPLPIDLGDGVMLRRYAMDDLDVLWEAVERDHERIAKWMPWAIGVTRDAERDRKSVV